MLRISLLYLSFFLCLNLGKAQAPPPVATTSTPQTTGPNGAVSSTDPLISILSSVKTAAGKYDEYQSVCRENENDNADDLIPEQQQQRINILNEKMKKTLVISKLKLRLLKEYVDQRRFTEAELFFKKLKEEKISDEDSRTADALFAITKNDLKRAISILSKIVLENEKNADALKYLAEIYKLDKNYYEASTAYFDLAKLTNENYDLELCEVQTLYSQHAEASLICKKAAQNNPANPYPLIYLGVSQREKLNYVESIRYFKESIKRKPTEMGYVCMAEIYFIKDNYVAASEAFKRASAISPRSTRADLGLAWSQFKNKKYPESLVTFKLACSKDKRVKVEIRRAFKILADEKSNASRGFADLAQSCND